MTGRPRGRRARRLLGAAALVAAAGAGWGAWGALRPLPPRAEGDPSAGARAFLESDLGSGAYGSIPVRLFDALPALFPDRFPSDLDLIGLYRKPAAIDDGLPVGFVRTRRLGVDFAASNCALCHAGRLERGAPIVPGMPNRDLDVQALFRALDEVLRDPRLTGDAALRAIDRRPGPRAGRWERTVIRLWIARARQLVAGRPRPRFSGETGPGRSDAVNGWKRALHLDEGPARSYVDIPPLYNQRLKARTLLDGSITGDPAARVMLTEVQKGRPDRDLLLHRQVFDDLVAWVGTLRAPRFPAAIDAARAADGHAVFERRCARCHGTYGPTGGRTYPSKRIDLDYVGTDPERAEAMSPPLIAALSRRAFRDFLTISPKRAYVPPPLDGVWASAPYLHNGSVPTLWHLFQAEPRRPARFYRRANRYDLARVGLACAERQEGGRIVCGPDEEQRRRDPGGRWLFAQDARGRGNGNQGHPFTVEVPEGDKGAVLEYLKTL